MSKKDKKRPIFTDSDKIKAIKTMLRHGPRFDEWAEAGMLHQIEDIVNGNIKDLSSETIKALMDKGRNF